MVCISTCLGNSHILMLCARGCSGHSSVSRTTSSRATSLDIDLACIYGAKTDSAPRHDDRRSEMRCAERRLSNCRKRPVSFMNRKPYFFVHGCFIVCAAFCPRFRLYVRAYVVGITMTQHNARVWQTGGRRDNLNSLSVMRVEFGMSVYAPCCNKAIDWLMDG